jgi:PXPV repeat (3 copies)
MKKILTVAALSVATLALSGCVGYYPAYVAPAPVYVAPAPVYVAPPVYIRPAPVCVQRRSWNSLYGTWNYYRVCR